MTRPQIKPRGICNDHLRERSVTSNLRSTFLKIIELLLLMHRDLQPYTRMVLCEKLQVTEGIILKDWRLYVYKRVCNEDIVNHTEPKDLESVLQAELSPTTQQWPSGTLTVSSEGRSIQSPGNPTILFTYFSLQLLGEL